MIPFVDLEPRGVLRRELDAAYERVMSSGWYIGGYEVEAFEKEWAEYCEVEHCVACGNGFDALQLVLRAKGIGPGWIVVVPEWTAVATWAAVEAVGAKPFVPNESWNRWIEYSSAAIIRVHLYGIASKVKWDYSLKDVQFITDGAQSHGMLTGTSKDANGGITCWSFYPTKNLGCYGDGGAVTSPALSLIEKIRELRRYGSPHAINSCLDPLQAAFLRVKLPYLDGWNETRRQHAARYLDGLKGLPLTLPKVPEWCEPVWHQFVIQTPRRDELRAYLDVCNVETDIHYPVPPHRMLGYDYDLPEADRLAREVLSLPVGPHLTDEDIQYVIKAIKEWATDED